MLLATGLLLFPPGITGQDQSEIRFVNIGKMYIAPNSVADKATVYIPDALSMKGTEVNVKQHGITSLGGHFHNDVEANNIFDTESTGTFRFCSTSISQWIMGTADREVCYIAFPNVEVQNPASVQLSSTMGMDVKSLLLTRGKIVLKSIPVDDVSSNVAHMRVLGNVSYNHDAPVIADKGVVEVELDLQTQGGRERHFFGFSSPYRKMYADYFAFCYLARPDSKGLFGSTGKTIIDPSYPLQSGEAYLVAQDVFGEAGLTRDQEYESSEFSDRMKDMLLLNRWVMNTSINVVPGLLGNNSPYTDEELCTTDVPLSLESGYNYIGNPYTSPLDVTSLLDDETTGTDPWQVTRGTAGNLRARFWLLQGGLTVPTSAAENYNPETQRFRLAASWMVAQKVGDTYTLEGIGPSERILLEPMQIMRLQAKATTMTIPASKQSHGKGVFLRSAAQSGPDDELLLQVMDTDTRAYDRLCVVFRPATSLDSGDNFDCEKIFNFSGGLSQIHTPSADGKNLMVSVVPTQTGSLPVSLTPCDREKEVTLSAHRLASLHSPEGIWLEDLLTGDIIDLTQHHNYRFTTRPDDNTGRFVLHFTRKIPSGIEPITNSSLYVSYNKGIISISGLTNLDKGSLINVYDLQGRIVLSTSIQTDEHLLNIPFNTTAGMYIIKVSGKRSHTSKFLCQ